MTRSTRRSGVVLIILGVLGGLYFWLTDPRWGRRRSRGTGLGDMRLAVPTAGSPDNPVDAANIGVAEHGGGDGGVADGVGHRGLADPSADRLKPAGVR